MTRAPWLIDAADRVSIERYLISAALLQTAELPIAIERAGAGNMNLALRVTAGTRSFVVKQGRPWVEKYPQIAAPFERTLVEAAFYAAVSELSAVAARMPAVLYVDRDNHILVLEDVGREGDLTSIYADGVMSPSVLTALLDWLRDLARVSLSADSRVVLANRAMRALNHEHMFCFPLRADNGLDLDVVTPGLGGAAQQLAADRAYVDAVTALGQHYLADGETLVHGDYFPGSWLTRGGGVRIIDPEFCFPGDPEFDLGILTAHLCLARCAASSLDQVIASAGARGLDLIRLAGYAGVEIMRRLIGVAQLPLTLGIETKRDLLGLSRRLVVEPDRGLT